MRGTTLKRDGATQLGDLRGLLAPADRTTLVRIGLVLALAASLAGAILLARSAGSGGGPVFGATPWSQFSAGTRISRGLSMGQEALQRAHVTHGSLLLISDLNDSSADEEPLVAEALALKKAHISVQIVPVLAGPADVRIFATLFGYDAFVPPS